MTQNTETTTVLEANQRMQSAWNLGHEVLQKIGQRAGHGAMRREFGGNASYAEKLRKYRGMASVITKGELKAICRRCIAANRPWGAQFLVELSRLSDSELRKKLSGDAIENHWGLSELKRHIRIKLGQQEGAKAKSRQHAGVGRKRKIDWTDERLVLDELSHLCVTWIRFAADLKRAMEVQHELGQANGIPAQLISHIKVIAEEIAALQAKAERRQDRLSAPRHAPE